MVGSDYEHIANSGPKKRNVKIHDVDGRKLGKYPVQLDVGSYQLVWKGDSFPVRKGEEGREKGKYYLTNRGDVERLGEKPES